MGRTVRIGTPLRNVLGAVPFSGDDPEKNIRSLYGSERVDDATLRASIIAILPSSPNVAAAKPPAA